MKKSLTNHVKHSSSSYARNPRTRSIASRLAVSGHFEHSSPSCARTKFHFINPRSGFTLIELMVSLALGLIIVAAATQLFITGLTSYKLQKAMAHIQDSASFGLNFIVDDIRKANLSSPMPAVNDQIAYSGIILTSKNVGSKINLNCTACFDEEEDRPLKRYQRANLNNTTENDQLLIRYQAQQESFDCSGNELKKDVFVVQRYYVDPAETNGRRSLRCQAVQYTQAELEYAKKENKSLELGIEKQASQVILPNVDYFAVRYGWMDGGLNDESSKIQYGSLDTYLTQSVRKNIDGVMQDVSPHIHAIQIGVLVQSTDTTGNQSIAKERNSRAFQVLGSEVELDKKYQNGHLRQAVNQTISLRNAMGWVSEGCKADVDDCTGGDET